MLPEPTSAILEPLRYPRAALDGVATAQLRSELVIRDYAVHQMNGMEPIIECRRLARQLTRV